MTCVSLMQVELQLRALGATGCTAHTEVLKNIAKQLEKHNIVSTQELQIARRMGIVATIPVARAGFNDGIFFPYELSTAAPASASVIPEVAVPPPPPQKPKKPQIPPISLLTPF